MLFPLLAIGLLQWHRESQSIAVKRQRQTMKTRQYVHFATLPKFLPPHFLQVTTKAISNVHGGISRKMNGWFPWVCLSGLKQRSKFCHKICKVYVETNAACGWEWDYSTLCAAELTGLSSFQNAVSRVPGSENWILGRIAPDTKIQFYCN